MIRKKDREYDPNAPEQGAHAAAFTCLVECLEEAFTNDI